MNKILSAILLAFVVSTASAQITSTWHGNGTSTQAVAQAQDAVNKVLTESGILFKEGLIAYEAKNSSEAGKKFNQAVEVFLYSKLNIQRDGKLQGCYNQLIETIYRLEFPTESQLPQVSSLAQTCGWSIIDPSFGDKVTMIARSSLSKFELFPPIVISRPNSKTSDTAGFKSQEFEPSPLDELAKIELTSSDADASKHPTVRCNLTNPPAFRGMRLGMSVAQVEKALGFKLILATGHSSPYLYQNEDKELEAQIRKLKIADADASSQYPGNYMFRRKGHASGELFGFEEVPKIEGISRFILHFYNNSLYSMWIDYEQKGFNWKNSREFALILSEKSGLPGDSWDTYTWDLDVLEERKGYEDESTVGCNTFILSVQAKGSYSHVSIFDKKVHGIVRAIENRRMQLAIDNEVKRLQAAKVEAQRKKAIETEVKQIKEIEKKRTFPF